MLPASFMTVSSFCNPTCPNATEANCSKCIYGCGSSCNKTTIVLPLPTSALHAYSTTFFQNGTNHPFSDETDISRSFSRLWGNVLSCRSNVWFGNLASRDDGHRDRSVEEKIIYLPKKTDLAGIINLLGRLNDVQNSTQSETDD
jgi:hypothetical protein